MGAERTLEAMKPFLLITSRDDDSVVLPEVASYQELTGLTDAEMVWHRVERGSLDGINPLDYSGIILGGSPFTISKPIEEKTDKELAVERHLAGFLDKVIDLDAPFLGICYGIGTIGKHQGAHVDGTYGENAQVAKVELTDAGREDPLFAELPDVFDGFVGHKEAIRDIPPHFAVLATSSSCPVQAFRVKNNVYATQFHPEMTSEAMADRLRAYRGHGYFDDAALDELIQDVMNADVRASHLVLARFIERYARSEAVAA